MYRRYVRFEAAKGCGDVGTISLCMIVKNEEAVLARCLDSVKGLVDEMVIVDTGSSDRTKEIARQYTGRMFDFPWKEDFSAARNFSFSQAAMDYCMWLDADDVFPAGERERFLELKQRLNGEADMVMMPYQTAFDEKGNPTFSYYRERIVKNNTGFVWEGAVHEAITPSGCILYEDIPIRHQKQGEGDPGRNIKIYERLREERALSPREQFYYARELMYHGRLREAETEFSRFLEKGNGWVENNIDACRQRAFCRRMLGEKKEALDSLFLSFSYDLPRAETCCDAGWIFLEQGDPVRAAFWYETALSCPRRDTSGAFVEQDCYGFLPCLQLCVCYDRLGEYEKAKAFNERAAAFKPEDPAVASNRLYFQFREQAKPGVASSTGRE